MNTASNIVDKVKKLLALATSSNLNEAANAIAIANKLIDQYRINEHELHGELDSECIIEDTNYIYETGRIVPWKMELIRVLANHYGCVVFNHISYSSGRKYSRFKLIGFLGDIKVVHYMFEWLVQQCTYLTNLHCKGKGHIFIASYCEGFVRGIAEQLKISRQEIKETATSNAIIYLDNRLQKSQQFLNSKYNIKTVKQISHGYNDPRGFEAGHQQGKALLIQDKILE